MILFVTGTEPYLVREQLDQIVARAGQTGTDPSAITRIDGTTSGLPQVREAVAAGSLFSSGKRLVVLEGWLANHSAGENDELVGVLEAVPADTVVVVVETTAPDRRQSATKKLEKLAERFWKLETLDESAAARWLAKTATDRGAKLSPALARRLVAALGTDLWTLSTELDKLAAAAHGKPEISDAMIDRLVTSTEEGNVWDLVDSLSRGDARTGLTQYRRLLDAGEPPLRIFAMIVRQFRILLGAKAMDGQPDAAIATALGIHPFAAKQAKRFTDRFTEEDLKRAFDELADLDFAIKTGKRDPEQAIELFIAERGVPVA